MLYDEVATAVAATGFVARGGFVPAPGDAVPATVGGAATRSVVVVGNAGAAFWRRFRTAQAQLPEGADPLDRWTRSVLQPLATAFGAAFVHPSDEPFQPFQRWAARADDVWPSPIGLLVHPDLGLWHAYRGAFLFPVELPDLPPVGGRRSPCLDCADQPCLHACPVDAFRLDPVGATIYDVEACADHVHSAREPQCLDVGCAARLACPVNAGGRYEPDQMRFHMAAFSGVGS